jgi:hypothetical protein
MQFVSYRNNANMKGHLVNIYFLLTLGPPLPKALNGISIVEVQGDAFLFGGYGGGYNLAIYRLTCSSGICCWSTLNQELKVPREYTVVIPVPDNFCK